MTESKTVHFLAPTTREARQSKLVAFVPQGETVLVVTHDHSGTSEVQMSRADAREHYRFLRDDECLGAVESDVALIGDRDRFMTWGSGLAASLAAAEAWKERLYQNYHPAGYGTMARFEELEHGFVKVSYRRSNSCD
jgi:hypothetical protein